MLSQGQIQQIIRAHRAQQLQQIPSEAPTVRMLQERVEGYLVQAGMMDWSEAELMARCATCIPSGGLYVEIGIGSGGTSSLVSCVNHSIRSILIDPLMISAFPHGQEDSPETALNFVIENLRLNGVLDRVTLLRSESESVGRMWRGIIDCLLIDGDHTYAPVLSDLQQFACWVRPGGHLILDDFYLEDIQRAWSEYRAMTPTFWIEEHVGRKLLVLRRDALS